MSSETSAIAHYEKWERIAQEVGIDRVRRLVLQLVATEERIKASLREDEHLNNIPLELWYRLHPLVKQDLAKAQPIEGTSQGWASLSDAVCLGKHVATYYIAGERPPGDKGAQEGATA